LDFNWAWPGKGQMLDKVEILTRLEEALKRKKSARGAYLWAVTDFLGTSPKSLNEEAVLSYIDKREKAGDKPGTLKLRFYALKYLFKLYDADWTLAENEVFSTRERRQRFPQPWFRKEEVIDIITKAKKACNPQELAMLAISTTYGCRRSELADIRKDDLDFEAKTITIYARKGGRVATQLLPDEIIPYLSNYDFPKVSDLRVSQVMNKILEKTIGPKEGYGWHSFRRSVATELRNAGVEEGDIYSFLRWSTGSILMTYIQTEPRQNKEKIFPKHPFIQYWR